MRQEKYRHYTIKGDDRHAVIIAGNRHWPLEEFDNRNAFDRAAQYAKENLTGPNHTTAPPTEEVRPGGGEDEKGD